MSGKCGQSAARRHAGRRLRRLLHGVAGVLLLALVGCETLPAPRSERSFDAPER